MSTYKVRTIKTTSKATAVQVVEYFNNKRNIVFHLGSASNKEDLELLKDAALKWIDKNDPQASLFPLSKKYDAGSVESKICFMALAIAKYIEIKTKKSITSAIKELKRVTDARIYDKINKREFVMRSKMNDEVKKILEMI